jgi:hypothetical protein
VPYLESVGIKYLRTETIPSIFSSLGENLGYGNFTAAYGNIYTSRQLRQLYDRATGLFKPSEDRWLIGGEVIDPFRPGLRFPAKSEDEFEFIQQSHFAAIRKAFESADVFVFTLGLTEAWINKIDGSTYPTCPGTIAGTFDSEKYEFKNFTAQEIIEDLKYFIDSVRIKNPKLKFIITVSPVPLVATATNNHVLVASTYSKSVLRVAAEAVTKMNSNVYYFPAYEIITGPQAPDSYFEKDKRNVSKIGVDEVMNALLKACNLKPKRKLKEKGSIQTSLIEKISSKITTAECDEAMLDPNFF